MDKNNTAKSEIKQENPISDALRTADNDGADSNGWNSPEDKVEWENESLVNEVKGSDDPLEDRHEPQDEWCDIDFFPYDEED